MYIIKIYKYISPQDYNFYLMNFLVNICLQLPYLGLAAALSYYVHSSTVIFQSWSIYQIIRGTVKIFLSFVPCLFWILGFMFSNAAERAEQESSRKNNKKCSEKSLGDFLFSFGHQLKNTMYISS